MTINLIKVDDPQCFGFKVNNVAILAHSQLLSSVRKALKHRCTYPWLISVVLLRTSGQTNTKQACSVIDFKLQPESVPAFLKNNTEISNIWKEHSRLVAFIQLIYSHIVKFVRHETATIRHF